jgi:hypothetical protein
VIFSLNKSIFIFLASICCVIGCVSKKQPPTITAGKMIGTNQTIVMPALSAVGHVAYVNRASRFAVLDYPIGSMPVLRQKLNVYRNNLKVAELIVTGPKTDGNIIADITTGEVQAGDEVRED